MEILLIAGEVSDLKAGIYRYKPEGHELLLLLEGDRRRELSRAALNQSSLQDAPAVIAIAGVYERTTVKYGERGIHYGHIEVGCTLENVHLQATSLGLGTVFIGAFHDARVKDVLQLQANEKPLGLMPVGSRLVRG